jgi:hypothetical protein
MSVEYYECLGTASTIWNFPVAANKEPCQGDNSTGVFTAPGRRVAQG